MIWDDKGFLISKFKYNENSVIADFFTLKYGRCSGIESGKKGFRTRSILSWGSGLEWNPAVA